MRFAVDENFNGKILNKLRERLPELDMVRVQDTPLYGAPDDVVLAWAATENRVLLTRDVQTLVNDAYDRVRAGLPMPG
jgi:predicted nuclease of predicted toxin-antitoxin system